MAKKYPIPNGYTPLNYEQINNVTGHVQPSMLKYCNAVTYAYWQRSLFQRAISTIEFKGLPDEWQGSVKDFFYWCLFAYGYVGVFDSEKFGFTFQPGALNGYDWYYQPTEFIVANPKLQGMSGRYKIHEDCEIIKLTPDYRGIFDIISYYAMLLSALDGGINTSIVNSKLAWLMGAKNKAAAWEFVSYIAGIDGERQMMQCNMTVPNQKSLAYSEEYLSSTNNFAPANRIVAAEMSEVASVGDWAYVEDGEWIGDWSNVLNTQVRNGKMTLEQFFQNEDVVGTNEILKKYKSKKYTG